MISKGIKRFAITIIIIALIVAAFVVLGGRSKSSTATSTTSTSGLATSSGTPVVPGGGAEDPNTENIDEFSTLLSTIQSIAIDTTIFADPAYLALRNNPIQLGTEIIGRTNPFATIGTDSAVTGSASAIGVVTLQPGKVTSTSAELGAQLTLVDTEPVSIVFEYGPSDTFGSTTSPQSVTYTGPVLTSISGLQPSTTYYVRAIAAKGSNITTGNIMTFTTTGTVKR